MRAIILLELISAYAYVAAQMPSYAPKTVQCPSQSLIQYTGNPIDKNQKLLQSELDWLSQREALTERPWQDYLQNIDIGYDLAGVLVSKPRVALSWSGGGIRATLVDAGTAKAFDGREQNNVAPLLQLASYTSGTSAGSWFLTSLLANNMPQMDSLVYGGNGAPGWKSNIPFTGVNRQNATGAMTSSYFNSIMGKVRAKAAAGYPISMVDAWAQVINLHYMNGTTANNFFKLGPHDDGTLYSDMRNQQVFADKQMPFPIMTMCSSISNLSDIYLRQTAGQTTIPLSNIAYEMSPYFFGSYELPLQSMIDMQYLGTNMSNGNPINSQSCTIGYDNAGFLTGASGSAFIKAVAVLPKPFREVQTWVTSLLQMVTNYIQTLSTNPAQVNIYVANIVNPWFKWNPPNGDYEAKNDAIIQGIDGGFNGETLPLRPLLIRARAIDTIVTTDASGNETSGFYPIGDALYATRERTQNYLGPGFSGFPRMPDTLDQFRQQNLSSRITFFGCNASTGDVTDTQNGYPLIVYMPNRPVPSTDLQNVVKSSNVSTLASFALSANQDYVNAIYGDSYKLATSGYSGPNNPNPDPEWNKCLACALVERARQRSNLDRSPTCTQCFSRYCYS